MSPCLIKLLTVEGLQSVDYSAESLADAVPYEPTDGVYTVSRTFDTFNVLKFDAHLNRLEDSARREHIPLTIDRVRLRMALRSMIEETRFGDVRFRITIGRARPAGYILSVEPFEPIPPEIYTNGVRCVTLPGSARQNPAAKTVDWMHAREDITLPEGIYDGFLLDDEGYLLEGRGSNFYAVLDGVLHTAGTGVLPGIAQQIVFEVAPQLLPVCKEAATLDDIPHLQEAFLTSSSRGIIPVVEIDGITINGGERGDYTHALQAAYDAWVEAHLEAL